MEYGGYLFLSQSKIKSLGFQISEGDIRENDTCPHAFYLKYISKEWVYSSIYITRGMFSETITLGSCARGESVTNVPRKKNGDYYSPDIRIIEQSKLFKERAEVIGFEISDSNVQIPLINKFNDEVFITGEMDIFPVIIEDVPAIIDHKCSGDAYCDFSTMKKYKTLDSCWGDVSRLNILQPVIYRKLASNINMSTNIKWWKHTGVDYSRFTPLINEKLVSVIKDVGVDFYYYIVGYKKYENPDEQFNWFKAPVIDYEDIIYTTIINAAKEKYFKFKRSNFEPYFYDQQECKDCPIKMNCKKYLYGNKSKI